MTVLSLLRQLYSLDTLDTRFSAPPPTPLKSDGIEPRAPGRTDSKEGAEGASPPRWNTPEFYLYGLVFLVCVPQMYWAVVQVSQRKRVYQQAGCVLTGCSNIT
jgi:protein-cysteine N-palmitoyltransferase HHAT